MHDLTPKVLQKEHSMECDFARPDPGVFSKSGLSMHIRRPHRYWRILLVLLLAMAAGLAQAQPLLLTELPSGSLGTRADLLVEDGPPLSLVEAQARQREGLFHLGKRPVLNSGIGSRPVWVHLELLNPTAQALPLRLVAGTTWLDRLDVFIIHDGQVIASWQTGDDRPEAVGLTPAMGFIFAPRFPPGRSDLYLRADAIDPLVLPIELIPEEQAASSERLVRYSYGFLYGFLLALLAYNGMLFAGLRERSHLYYSVYLTSFILLNMAYTGHGYAWLWPGQPLLQRYAILVLMVLCGCCGLLFASRFLALAEHAPRVLNLVRLSALLGLISIALCILMGSQLGAALVAFNFITLFTIGMVLLGIITVRHGRAAGRYFLAAALCGMLGAASTTLAVWGWLPFTALTYHAMEFGITLEATLLALALAYQMRQQQQATTRAVDLYDLAPVGYVTLSEAGLILQANLSAATLLGVARSELVKQPIGRFILNEDQDIYSRHRKQLGEAQPCELRMVKDDGTPFWAHLAATTAQDEDGAPTLRVVLSDITERKRAEQQLRIAAAAFESQEGMLVTDVNGVILRVNRAFTKITGYPAEEVIGKNPRILNSGRQDAEFYASMWESIKNTGAWEGEIWNRRKNGEVYPEHLTITAVTDPAGIDTNYVAAFSDITLSKAAEEEIKALAFYDSLTQLPNRRLLMDRLNRALASSARSGRAGALLFIDLDNFKTLNDTLGHDIGDLLLQQVAERLIFCVREGDTVARLGGDEFVVMLEDLSEQALDAAAQTEIVGEKILAALNQPYQLKSHEYLGSPSIGATLFKAHELAIDELLKQADIAMYQAKKAGRNALRFFDPQMQAGVVVRASLEGELRKALENRQFQLHYQIQMDSSRRPLGAEALIRWQHPEHGLVLPVVFIPLAEETGMILPIGQWVLESACAQLKAWQQEALTRDLVLAVNISARQFHQPDFVAQVHAAVHRHAINPMLLKLELIESMLLEDIEDTIATMSALKEIGIQFSLDDFGTGYSSLQYLKRLPLDQIKIDQSFVRDLATDSSNKAIVRTIIAMAQSLNLDVIAEGVETEDQRQLLLDNGCTRYQGYLFGKPAPIEQFEALLKQG